MSARLFVASLLLLFLPAVAPASVDTSRFQDLQWRLIGPFRGGRVLAVTGVPGEPSHFYFGSVNGGVWETVDAGRTWLPIFDGQPIGSIGAIAIAPSRPSTIYVGTGEADMRSDIAQGDGMYRSTDGGKTWTHIGLRDSQQIARVVVDPADPNLVWVAALGHPYGPNAERGVYRSRDGGASWQKVLGRDDNTGAVDIALDPGSPRVVYAALWQARRTPWSIYPPSNGPGTGLFKSTDGGDTWTELKGNGLPDSPGRIGIAVAPSRTARVYAVIDAPAGGMYRSDDGGATWIRASADGRVWSRGWYFGGVTVEPENADVVYSANINLYRSTNAGATFTPIKGAPGGDDYHQLWVDPANPERRILGTDQGAVVSLNGGRTWSSWYNQPTAQFYHVITDTRFPYWVYGSQQDSGAAGVPSRTNTYQGINLTNFRETTAGGESDNIAPDPKNPEIIYGGRVDRLDTTTQQTRSIDPMIANLEQPRETWTLPLVFSRRDPRVLYFANQRLYRTDDGGDHWTVISEDLTREDPGVPSNLDPVTAALRPREGNRHGVIYSIAPSRLADHDIWVGTDDGRVLRTVDEGATWRDITPPALTSWSKVGIIDASHHDAETAYVAVDRHRLDDFRPYVYRTHDGGSSWQKVSTGIPDDCCVNVVREDPVRRGLLYAGTEKGVFVSFDDGDHWQSLQLNLPVTSVRDIDVHGNDVVIATHGRSFWVLDNITPLRQADTVVKAGEPLLYQPAPAVRERPAGFTGTPMPKDEPMAPNVPAGAMIDYVLSKAASTVTLEILDERGTLVRRYSSDDAVQKPDPARLRTAPEWLNKPSSLPTSPGMHRFIWPIRYPAAGDAGRGPAGDGIWAPPGRYSVALTVDGVRLTQTLLVLPDPRVTATPDAYAAQFELARQVEALDVRVSTALEEAEGLLARIAAAPPPGDPEVVKAVDAFRARVIGLTGVAPSTAPGGAWWLAPSSTRSLSFVSGALSRIRGAVDGSDGAPSKDAREGWARVQPLAESTLKQWEDVRTRELAALNERLKLVGGSAIGAQ